jgi:phosphohistidine phosphatase SixA
MSCARWRLGNGALAWLGTPAPGEARARVAIAALLLALAIPAMAPRAAGQPAGAPALHGPELLAALRGGGFILYFRHADTDHQQNDTRMRSVDDCANQRNLTDRGRERARAIGEAIRALGVPIGSVLASPMCRTMETARLAFGTAEPAPAAREAGPSPPGTPERYAALRGLLSTAPPSGKNTVIVGHGYPFHSLVGGQMLDEGQAAVVEPTAGGFRVVARVGLAEWRTLAEPAR